MKLKEKVAIVTGSSRGIGKAIAITFAKEGAKVVIAARTDKEWRLPGTIYQTAEEISSFEGIALPIKMDVTNEVEVEEMVKRTLQEFGRIDILVNNAAIGYYFPLKDVSIKHWDLVMKVNLRGPFLCIKFVLPTMIEQKSGNIINISSRAAENVYSSLPGRSGERVISGIAYGASKAALERLTIGLAAEVEEYNIAVNALKPGAAVLTEGLKSWRPEIENYASKLVSPYQYMTKAAVFLATQDAKGITGRVFIDKQLCEEYNLT